MSAVSIHRLLTSFFFFFFQAEDGIRDKLVTGVQTCALPICLAEAGCGASASRCYFLFILWDSVSRAASCCGTAARYACFCWKDLLLQPGSWRLQAGRVSCGGI